MYSLSEYYAEREKIVEENKNLVGVVLNDKEKLADTKLTELKTVFKASYKDELPYDMPMLNDDNLVNNGLYNFCRKLPKGSDLHVHGTALVPMNKLIDFIIDHNELLIDINTCILYLNKKENTYPLKEAIEKGYVTRDALMKKWTILGLEKGQRVWDFFEKIFDYHAAIDENIDILKDYYRFAFKYYLSINIFHIEIHVLMSKNQNKTDATIYAIKDAYHDVKKEDDRLIVSIIGTSMKMFESIEETKEIFNCILQNHINNRDDFDPNNVHDFVLGVDLVNEEDKSRSLKEYAPLLIDIKTNHPDFEYYLHCGESINSDNDNLIDAFLLKTERVGHGTNLYRYPSLLKQYADNEICLESCLISNQVLGYVKDLRLHPSAEYLKRGVTIALCSDDPMYFENESLVDDFFAAIVCWNLGLAEIKHLCINSIMYSGVDSYLKHKLMKDWKTAWDNFIEEVVR